MCCTLTTASASIRRPAAGPAGRRIVQNCPLEIALTHLFDAIQTQADLHPEAAAFASVDGMPLLSYRQLVTGAEAAAGWLRAHDVRGGACVVLGMPALSLAHPILLLGALRAGALVGSFGNQPDREWAALESLRPRVLSFEGEEPRTIEGADCLTVTARDVEGWLRTQRIVGLPPSADATATSGLLLFGGEARHIGALKLPVHVLFARVRDLALRLRLEPARGLGLALPASAPMDLEATLACWLVGGCVVRPASVPQLRLLLRSEANDVVVSSAVLRALLETNDEGSAPTALAAPSGRVFVLGGPLLPETAALANQRLGREPHLLLASAETGLFSFGSKADLSAHLGCVGRPVGSADVQAVDARGDVRPVGQDGLIRVTTPWMAAPCVDPRRAGERSPIGNPGDGWWASGLRGAIAPDGRIIISGVLAPLGRPAGN